jgi:hypothetical protein
MPKDNTIMGRWRRLAQQKGLDPKRDKEEYRKQRAAFIAKEVNKGFSLKFGDDANNVQGWMTLCSVVGIDGWKDFTSVNQCRMVTYS